MPLSVNAAMAVNQSPAWARRHLRTELRVLRETAGLTQKEAGEQLDWSQAKIMRIEKGHSKVDRGDLELLLRLYKVKPGPERDALLQLQRRGKVTNPLTLKYRSILPQVFRDFLEEEEAAQIIRHFEPLLVPGPLQTEGYAKAVLARFASAEIVGGNGKALQLLVDVRMARRQILKHGRGVEAFYLLDYSVLSRRVGAEEPDGGPAVMIEQLRYLKELNRTDHVTIQVLPASAGLYSATMRAPFDLLEFEANEMLLYAEDVSGDLALREDSEIVVERRDEFERMRTKASAKAELDEIIDVELVQLGAG